MSERRTQPQPRPVLLGRYELGPMLGAGAMGKVFEARDLLLGRSVAVKLMRSAHLRDEIALRRFEREARATAQLEHGNIVSLFDVGVQDGTPFIVMERVQGRTVRSLLDHQGRLAPDDAAAVVVQVCNALEAAHAAGIVHRDLKPSNIMVTDDGIVKVMDFGLAHASFDTRLTSTSTALGTAKYIAPEHARRAGLDARSDLYSMGVCLFEMLTGQPPFDRPAQVDVVYAHVHEPPPRPRSLLPSITPELEQVVLTALEKDPETRHQDATELRAALLRAVPLDRDGAQTVHAAVPRPPEELRQRAPFTNRLGVAWQRSRNERWRWAGLAVALIALELVILLGLPRLISWNQGSPVPDVRGMQLQTAVAELRGEGFDNIELADGFEKQQELTVVSQVPEPGARIRPAQGQIILTVADAPISGVVPDVQGMRPQQATAAISAAGPEPLPQGPTDHTRG